MSANTEVRIFKIDSTLNIFLTFKFAFSTSTIYMFNFESNFNIEFNFYVAIIFDVELTTMLN
jgi:hypothetical protein